MGINEMRALEAACQAHLKTLEASIDLGQMADVQTLCEALARQRRRPIHLEASQLPADVAGAWLATATALAGTSSAFLPEAASQSFTVPS